MADSVDYEILLNGVPRTWRDVEAEAIAAARVLFHREKGTGEIIVINRRTGMRCQVKDGFSDPAWVPLPA